MLHSIARTVLDKLDIAMETLHMRGAVIMKVLILHMYILCLQCAHAQSTRGFGRMSSEQFPRIFASHDHERDSSFRFIALQAVSQSGIHLAPGPFNERNDVSVLSNDSGVEVEALMAFKQALNETSRLILSSWNETALSPCKWKGITCSHESGRVVAIELAGLGLGGRISPLVGRLQDLQKLDLSDNFLAGKIPGSLVNCTRLGYLALPGNTISGPIPPQVGQLLQLQVLDLSTNYYLDGHIPESLGNCSSLKYVNLTNTILSSAIPETLGKLSLLEILDMGGTLNNGSVPASLGNCSLLRTLLLGNTYLNFYSDGPNSPNQFSLSNSELSGTLPDELRGLERLTVLGISGTNIGGLLPSWLANCTSMKAILLNYNEFSGTIPEYLGRLPLTDLGLYNNNFSGQIPRVIGNCSNLEYLFLGYLSLQGVIPQELGHLRKLAFLALVDMKIDGELPATLSNCSVLDTLTIGNLDMQTQALQPWIGSLRNLLHLSLSAIQLSGHIPAALGQLSLLNFLDFSSNQLNGSIEKSLANCSDLQTIYLLSNGLEGEIPVEIWRLQNMRIFYIYENNLTGILTDGIANMSNLELFVGFQNSFEGTLPRRITELSYLSYLDLGANNFHGNLPASLGNMSSMQELDIGHNSLHGSIPASIGNLSLEYYLDLSFNGLTGALPADLMRCIQLSYIYLQVNVLDGSIPVEIGQLSLLQELRLYNNNLSGNLPLTLGLCTKLQILDVSYNKLYGELPGDIFINASFSLSTLNLSHNNFSGAMPRTLGAQTVLVEIYLSANNFSGPISAGLGEVQSLQSLDFSWNNLSGPIPKALGNLQNLTLFNVSYNYLEGPLPDTGVFSSSNFSAGWFASNPQLCGSRLLKPCPGLEAASQCKGLSCHIGSLTAITVCSAAFGLLFVVVGMYLISQQWRAHIRGKTMDVESQIHMFAAQVCLSSQDLVKTIDDPAKLIAHGTNSSVYRADLEGGPIVIKILQTVVGEFPVQLEEGLEKALSQMQREAHMLAELRHRNILKVLGMFSTSKITGLMLEFMPLGSLHDQLHGTKPSNLSWENRLDIALGIAQGLVYLHRDVEVPIIHRDLKPQNILLDADMTPKLGDFGISKFSKVGDSQAVTASQWCGTVGYIPPEYARNTRVSTHGDVYAFGIILLELLTARQPTTEANNEDGDLPSQSSSPLSKGGKLHSINPLIDWVYQWYSIESLSMAAVVDQSLLGLDGKLAEKEEQQTKMVIQVGLLCTQDNPQSRPRMHDVLAMLTYIKRLGAGPTKIPSVDELVQEEDYAALS